MNASEFLFEGVVLDGLQCPYNVDMDSNVTVHVLPSGLYTQLLQDGIPGRDELDPEIKLLLASFCGKILFVRFLKK